jgi:dihydroflavonol-4-reductase
VLTGAPNTVAVTGGNGFIGSRVVAMLCAQGYTVRCLVRDGSNLERLDGLKIDYVSGDVRDPSTLKNLLHGAKSCIHLASVSAWGKLGTDHLEETIVEGTRNVLSAALVARCRRVVIVSSVLAVNGTPSPCIMNEDADFDLWATRMRYAHAKRRAEDVAGEFSMLGLDVVRVNPVETFGDEDFDLVTSRNLLDFLTNWPCLVTRGGTAIAGVTEVAEGIVSAMQRGRGGERYILGGDNLSITQLARLTLSIAGQRKPVVYVPLGVLKVVVALLSRLNLPTPVVPGVLDYLGYYYYVDSVKAVRELGYQPRPARDVLEPAVRWLRESGHLVAR